MLVLGINTVGDACEAALVRGGEVVCALSEPMRNGHDARLAPLVARVMREGGREFGELARIAVVAGPGSFTGVRVGVAFARGLGLALDRPAVGVTSLEALDGLPQEGGVLGLLAAKRRPPERTFWVQALVEGRGLAPPDETDEAGVRVMLAAAGRACGAVGLIADPGPHAVEASPSARAAALFAARLEGDLLPPARPVYVREPDARPMRAP